MAVVLNGGLAAQATIGDGGVRDRRLPQVPPSSRTLESGAAEIVSSGGADVATFVGSGGSATVDGSAMEQAPVQRAAGPFNIGTTAT